MSALSAELHVRVDRLLAGERYTAGRRRIVDVLATAARPLTIPEILERDGGLSQSSVYRNVAVLERSGAVQRVVSTGEWSRFELAEELTEHHHHLICSACGAVRDITVPSALERSLERSIDDLASSEGFAIHHHRLDLVGRCAACA
jgi:Fur family transcriptional regulator, ferric uptake regulator